MYFIMFTFTICVSDRLNYVEGGSTTDKTQFSSN